MQAGLETLLPYLKKNQVPGGLPQCPGHRRTRSLYGSQLSHNSTTKSLDVRKLRNKVTNGTVTLPIPFKHYRNAARKLCI